MARLSQQELRSRLAFDWKVMRGLASTAIGLIRGFVTADDARRGKDATAADGDAGRITNYTVEYRFPLLVGPGPTTPSATCRVDLLAGGNYPFSTPAASFVSRPLPWCEHVHPLTGMVCLGEGWARTRGRMLAAQLVVHVMRLVNYDEPDRGPAYDRWNPEAMQYWRSVLRGRPLHANLHYPTLPVEITHGVEDPAAGFAPAPIEAFAASTTAAVASAVVAFRPTDSALFVPACDAGPAPSFRPTAVGIADFRPIGVAQ